MRSQAHFDIRSITPARAALPFTETGYRSHFVHPSEVEAVGGPDAYVLAWLNEASGSQQWREFEAAGQQLSLF